MRLTLAWRISIIIVSVLLLTLVSSVVAITSAYRFKAYQETIVLDNLESVRAAEELEIALLDQRGYVSSFILDNGNGEWLEELDKHGTAFRDWIELADAAARSPEEREVLTQLEHVHQDYSHKRDRAIELYQQGSVGEATRVLLEDVTDAYNQAYDLCERFISLNQQLVDQALVGVRRQVTRVTFLLTVTFVITLVLAAVLLWLFFRGVIFPLQRIAAEVRSVTGSETPASRSAPNDEMRELGHYVQLLMTDVAIARSDLEQSRTELAHAEKLATVGKLAASVAHEIRNPLTSMKMWLFSLRRAAGPDLELKKKLEMISEEILRLDNIVSSFLEFSRPPVLHLQRVHLPELVDATVELIRPQLTHQHITLHRSDETQLADVQVDPEQIRQVLLNLIKNSLDAMPEGGQLEITCKRARKGRRSMIAVHVRDTGSGMNRETQARVFEPFFSTKESGTGLGLCVAASVMARHNGQLEMEASGPAGTHWIVWIPAPELA